MHIVLAILHPIPEKLCEVILKKNSMTKLRGDGIL